MRQTPGRNEGNTLHLPVGSMRSSNLMKFILRYLELIFTAIGLLVIFGVTALIRPAGTSAWVVAAISATSVGVIHGILFWLIRRRQRETRRVALLEVERMLRDIVLNQLAIIRISVELQHTPAVFKDPRLALENVEKAIDVIHTTLCELSEESLARWKSHYRQ